MVPDTAHLIEEYGKKDRDVVDILRIVSQEISNVVKENKEINNKKVEFIRYGSDTLLAGVVTIIIFGFLLLLV